jgi:hypothetical protein
MTACNKGLRNKPEASGKQPTAAQKAQHDMMKTCIAEAKGMKGDERKEGQYSLYSASGTTYHRRPIFFGRG